MIALVVWLSMTVGYLVQLYIAQDFHSGLCTLYDESRRSKSGKLVAAINSDDDSAKIEDINKRVTLLLESFWASYLDLSVLDLTYHDRDPHSWRIISRALSF
jgi:hypothetical protein